MQYSIRFSLFLVFVFACTAPKGLVEQTQVDRVIRTLAADDMQGRKTFEKGIEKAALFLDQEFRNIGLQTPAGGKDYLQRFTLFQVVPQDSEVLLNGKKLKPEEYFFNAAQESLNLTLAEAQVQTIGAGDDFRKRFGELEEAATKSLRIVLINPAHTNIFGRYKAYMSKNIPLISDLKSSKSVIYIVSEITNPNEITGVLKSKVEKKNLFNVVGILEGKSKKEEYVIFGGHYDHLGVIKAVGTDSIANGANDDASGTTAVVSLARYFKKQKNNERTLIFVAFTAEEMGLYGSKYFSEQYDPAKVVAMFNIEMIGQVSKWGKNAAFVTGFDKSDLGAILQKNLKGSPYQYYADPYPDLQLFYRSDNATLARKGVPAHTISTYREEDKLYHHVDDEYESLDVANMTEIIKSIAQAVGSVIAGTDTPSRIAPEKQ